jgi:hypothetical protein
VLGRKLGNSSAVKECKNMWEREERVGAACNRA